MSGFAGGPSEMQRVVEGLSDGKGGQGGGNTVALQPIPFHGDAVWAGEADGRVLVALKPICETLGVDWNGQYQRAKRDAVLAQGMCVTHIPSPGGVQEAVCLPLTLLPGFLFGISAERIADPVTRQRVIAYKLECHAVLHRHFFGRREAETDPASLPLMDKARFLREIRLAGGKEAAAPWLVRLGLALPASEARSASSGAIDQVATERVRLFLANCTREALDCRVQAKDMFAACNRFLAAHGHPKLNNVRFGRAMSACGVAKERGSRYFYLGREVVNPPPPLGIGSN